MIQKKRNRCNLIYNMLLIIWQLIILVQNKKLNKTKRRQLIELNFDDHGVAIVGGGALLFLIMLVMIKYALKWQ